MSRTTVLRGKEEKLSQLAKYQTVHVTGNTVFIEGGFGRDFRSKPFENKSIKTNKFPTSMQFAHKKKQQFANMST